ncbi:hypothetical protein WNY37_00455 [Henriciella sp. AS95]|uniref:hypothetical protein n=1 Tax=Henriciella sp. AS95 TaxID=3135782 RepID=UPI00316B7786
MAQSDEKLTKHYYGGQIGLAIVALSVCAACGVAWLADSPGSSNAVLSYVPPSTHTADAPIAERPHISGTGDRVVDNDLVRPASVTGAASTAAIVEYAIIVRFEREPLIEEIGRTFRKDPEGSRAKFARWAADEPALRGLHLERASYSGEVVLAGSGARSLSSVISEIEAMDNVVYVERDYSAKASKEG